MVLLVLHVLAMLMVICMQLWVVLFVGAVLPPPHRRCQNVAVSTRDRESGVFSIQVQIKNCLTPSSCYGIYRGYPLLVVRWAWARQIRNLKGSEAP